MTKAEYVISELNRRIYSLGRSLTKISYKYKRNSKNVERFVSSLLDGLLKKKILYFSMYDLKSLLCRERIDPDSVPNEVLSEILSIIRGLIRGKSRDDLIIMVAYMRLKRNRNIRRLLQ